VNGKKDKAHNSVALLRASVKIFPFPLSTPLVSCLAYPSVKMAVLVEFEVLTSVVMKNTVFWDIMLCTPWQNYACCLLSRWFLAQLVLCPEDRGGMFLQNIV
jgi:hypothetical protein